MILLIFGIYAIITGKLMVTKRYGLRDGARVGGVICIVFALGLFGQVFS